MRVQVGWGGWSRGTSYAAVRNALEVQKGDQQMKKGIREMESEWKQRPERTVGIDLGDRFSRYCVLNRDGEVLEEGQVRTGAEGFRRHWEGELRQRIVMETGTHSPWISRLLQSFGHQVIVANARKLRAISQNESNNHLPHPEIQPRRAYCHPKLFP